MTAAVALAHMSPHEISHQGSHFLEQPEDLLDKLLRACKPKPSVALLPGFGRDLQPYFSPEAVGVFADAQPKRSRGNKSPHKGASGSTKQATFKKLTPVPATAVSKKGKQAAISNTPVEEVATVLASWAGPGFYNPPPPEQLPMPSLALLG